MTNIYFFYGVIVIIYVFFQNVCHFLRGIEVYFIIFLRCYPKSPLPFRGCPPKACLPVGRGDKFGIINVFINNQRISPI
jgi:hypothetical protein